MSKCLFLCRYAAFDAGEEALVPAFGPLRVLKFIARRRKAGTDFCGTNAGLSQRSGGTSTTVDHASTEQVFGMVQMLCRDHGLTPYDALYVELARRTQSSLATLDQSQKDAAAVLNIECL
jgi:hypothetical protein